ncbi:APSES transcription factor StuA [Drepanopeziza brunnea f. sp. 'multigermtubi' MB_m1]|uniref:APSES transcription factor StuA n=1 Tax=Marssonina brunnea f. sp. multigermtubi (strain MB_m1) TaxID=1072389 RepID=K1WW10_MARBU|nr:APSES transcription factor StuA [Drepanopeziza brunnea f. sp. 'multigermtubi' MB_m1]EKD12893.1 APSES transcription factor StuA [Drepanopeziza brunnea f. sp. 'multigermtubi' MB_m1]
MASEMHHQQQQQQSQDEMSNQYPQHAYDFNLEYPPPPPVQSHSAQLPLMAVPGHDHWEGTMSLDATGQTAPAGVHPRITATIWKDEDTVCFQVDVGGICVARREGPPLVSFSDPTSRILGQSPQSVRVCGKLTMVVDNHMINGTKLLNVAGMTRGRRDGILKSEKQKHVVKIGPMHLKGVWIPFERALELANKEKITTALYPLFVHNIGALLAHPVNSGYPAADVAQIPRNQEAIAYPQGMQNVRSDMIDPQMRGLSSVHAENENGQGAYEYGHI